MPEREDKPSEEAVSRTPLEMIALVKEALTKKERENKDKERRGLKLEPADFVIEFPGQLGGIEVNIATSLLPKKLRGNAFSDWNHHAFYGTNPSLVRRYSDRFKRQMGFEPQSILDVIAQREVELGKK